LAISRKNARKAYNVGQPTTVDASDNFVSTKCNLRENEVRHAANTIEEMRKLLLGYRDNMRVEVETGIAVTAKTVADIRALPTWPDGLALNIHVDLDPRFSVVRVERASKYV